MPRSSAVDSGSALCSFYLFDLILGSCLGPALPAIAHACLRVVVEVDGATALLLDILRLCAVVLATLLRLVREDGNVMPRRRMPVGVVVPLL